MFIDSAIKWFTRRLMQSTAEYLALAFARYDTSEKEAALAHARRLMESEDPTERELGEKLKAQVLTDQTAVFPALEAPSSEANGVSIDPLSHRSFPALPAEGSRSAASGEGLPQRKRGRPRKTEALPSPETETTGNAEEETLPRKRGRPRKS